MLKRVISDESGRALALTLIMLGIGVLLIPVFLSHASTNLLATRATEEGLKEQYAADAGVEKALWHLQDFQRLPGETPWELDEFAINAKPVNVVIEGATVADLKYGIWSGGDVDLMSSVDSITIGSDDYPHGVHSNDALYIPGHAGIHGACEYVTGDPPESCPGEPPSEPSDPPVNFDIADYAPGSDNANLEGGALYHCCQEHPECNSPPYNYLPCDGEGNLLVDNPDPPDLELEGLYYVSGYVKLTNIDNVYGGDRGFTIVAGEYIEVQDINDSWSQVSYIDDLLLFANGSPAIKIANVKNSFSAEGIIYAPGVGTDDLGIEIQNLDDTHAEFDLTGGLVSTGQVKIGNVADLSIISFDEGGGGALGEGIFKITSTATSDDGSSTTVVSYVQIEDSELEVRTYNINP